MAEVLSSSNTNLRITLSNQYGDTKNITVPNPKASLTSLESVQSAFSRLTSSDIFLAGTTYYTAVKTAQKVLTQRTDLT